MATSEPTRAKVLTLEELAVVLASQRQGHKVVQCHGDFEVVHPGYVKYLEEARRHGSLLVVTVTPDQYLPHPTSHTLFNEASRAQAVAALGMVDYVVVSSEPDGAAAIHRLRPDCVVRNAAEGGSEAAAALEIGAQLEKASTLVPGMIHTVSNPLSEYSPEVTKYLMEFSNRHSPGSVIKWLDEGRKLKVLVIGEAIIDEYHYCETMGKSGKEPILATRYLHSETFAGGILAVANNVAAFCDDVTVLTVLGSQNGQPDPSEPFIRQQLNPAVKPIFLYQEDAPTIVKRRYVEHYPLQKLFEVYFLKHMEENSSAARALCDQLEAILPEFDVVIVTDYGHGMLVPEAVEILSRKARFLAVNTQSNADNQGFNTISKYPRADFVSLSEKELRLEVRSKQREIGSLITEVAQRMGCRAMLITRGGLGNVIYDRELGISTAPVLSTRILDRVGAGDAVLSATSLCVAQGAAGDVVGFIGNLVGAHAVATVGHRTSLDRDRLATHMFAILS